MAIDEETPTWIEGIYQLEENDSPFGGRVGITNRQFTQLACRTNYLHELLKSLYANSVNGRTITTWTIKSTIKAETVVTIPAEYIVGARALILFSDITGEVSPKYYHEQGITGQLSSKISFTFDVPVGTVLTALVLAASVDKIEYDTTYNYEQAYTEHYNLILAEHQLGQFYIPYCTHDAYNVSIEDNYLDVAKVTEDFDDYELIKNIRETSGSLLRMSLSEYDDLLFDEIELHILKNNSRLREDISLVDKSQLCGHVLDTQVDIFNYDYPEFSDDFNVTVYNKRTIWIDDADFIDKYTSIDDSELRVVVYKSGILQEDESPIDTYVFSISDSKLAAACSCTALKDMLSNSADGVAYTASIVCQDTVATANGVLSGSAMLGCTDSITVSNTSLECVVSATAMSDTLNTVTDDWEITVSDTKNS